MKQTIAISTFAGMLARQSGYTADFCERFVIEMFKTVADALRESDNVNIKGLGKFAVDSSGNVDFIPDDTFAADVNAPFDCFEPEPIDDSVTDEILSSDDATPGNNVGSAAVPGGDTENTDTEEATSEKEPEDKSGSNADTVEEVSVGTGNGNEEAEGTPADEEISSDMKEMVGTHDEPSAETGTVAETVTTYLSQTHSDFEEKAVGDTCDTAKNDAGKNKRRLHNFKWFIAGIVVGIIVRGAAACFISDDDQEKEPEVSDPVIEAVKGSRDDVQSLDPAEIKIESVDSVSTVPMAAKAQVDTVIYDKVTSTLAQLSRKHYGSYEFWVYIYEENTDVISDPDRVEPDTKVRIPSPGKYGIDAGNKESIRAALKKSQELANKRNGAK